MSERAHLGTLTHDTSVYHLLRVLPTDLPRVLDPRSMAYEAATNLEGPARFRALRLALGTFGDSKPAFVHDGKPVDHWMLLLNTLIQRGDDSMRLAARIHAQCEIHGFVEGPDRAWLAALIRGARDAQVFRDEVGWEAVVALLEARDDEPVVLSYSVCDSFPNAYASTWVADEGDEDRDGWFELPTEQQWKAGLEWLRTEGVQKGLRLDPNEWADYRFGHCLTAADLAAGGSKP